MKLKFFSCLPWALKGARAAFPETAEALQGGVPHPGCPGLPGQVLGDGEETPSSTSNFLLFCFFLLVAPAVLKPRSPEATPPPFQPEAHGTLHRPPGPLCPSGRPSVSLGQGEPGQVTHDELGAVKHWCRVEGGRGGRSQHPQCQSGLSLARWVKGSPQPC